MPARTPPTGRYSCRLDELQKLALLGPIAAKSQLEAKAGLAFLGSITWVVELEADGTLESVWHVDNGPSMPPVKGRYAAQPDGRIEISFPDAASWHGTVSAESLSFRHPDVGEVWMTPHPA